MIEVEAVSNAPRNIKQVKNVRAKLKRIMKINSTPFLHWEETQLDRVLKVFSGHRRQGSCM